MPLKDPEARRRHHREYMRRRYREEPEFRERQKARVRAANDRSRDARLAIINESKTKGCALCPETDPACLDHHHRDAEAKLFHVSESKGRSLEALRREIAKCIVLCANCHRKLHAGRVVLPAT